MSQQTTPTPEKLTVESGAPEPPRAPARRWIVIGPLTVVAIVAAAAFIAPNTARQQTPARASSAEPYPVSEMPARMAAALRDPLTKHGLEPEPTTFFAGDSDFAQVSRDDLSSARFMYVEVSGANHTWRLYTGAQVDGAPDPSTGCPPDFPSTLLCTIDAHPDGSITEERVMVAELNPVSGNFRLVDASKLDPGKLGDVRIEHSWTTYRNGTKTTVVETVIGPREIDGDRPFETTAADWKDALTDTSLVVSAG